MPLAMGFPVLWSNARSRLTATMVSAGYFLEASRGLPQAVANYYGANGLLGFVLWFGASSAFVLVYGALWSWREGSHKPIRFGIAILLMSVPPFGIVGWASPITAAGVLFPAWGWLGLAAAFILLLTMTTSRWPVAAAIIGMLWGWSAISWDMPSLPPGWIGIDTRFHGINGQYAGYQQERQTLDLVRAASASGHNRILLPESALGIWTPTVARMWADGLRGSGATIIAGAVIIDSVGYDNVLIELSGEGTRVLYRDRMPVPVSMWQPWLAWRGGTGGARAEPFANPVVNSGGARLAALICYEQLLVWPVLQSMLYRPELIIASGNGWWTDGTNIVAIQRATTEAWARLFDVPVVFAFNT